MKKLTSLAASALLLISCGPAALLNITVAENAGLSRTKETVELDMSRLQELNDEIAEGTFSVCSGKGNKPVPFQIYQEMDGRRILLFQADVKAGRKARYAIVKGASMPFDTIAYSRNVPERRDDYAYENDLVAGRIYGPSLKKPRTLGTDVWTKSVSRPVINERYERGKYHLDQGDGMDCYKVGNTLGAGALTAVSSDGSLILGDNWAEFKHLTDGPIRTKAWFVHGPFEIDGKKVCATRELTLDSGSHFLMMETRFSGVADSLDVALAAIMHDPYDFCAAEKWVAFVEPASDSKQPAADGDIFIAIIMDPNVPNSPMTMIEGHAALRTAAAENDCIRCWTGSAWNHADVKDLEQWTRIVEDFAERIAHPLSISVK